MLKMRRSDLPTEQRLLQLEMCYKMSRKRFNKLIFRSSALL